MNCSNEMNRRMTTTAKQQLKTIIYCAILPKKRENSQFPPSAFAINIANFTKNV